MGTKYVGTYSGNITIRVGDDVSELVRVAGGLMVYAPDAKFPALTVVRGSLSVYAPRASFPALTTVRGMLSVYAPDAHFPVLTVVNEELLVEATRTQLPALTTVCGTFNIVAANIHFPTLTTVAGRVIRIGAGCVLPPALRFMYGVSGQLMCAHTYALWRSDEGMWYAGCRGPWTTEQALAHWGHRSRYECPRAVAFTDAIKKTINP